MMDEVNLDNLSALDAWEALETMNMDKILGITKDEFIFIASLPKTMTEDEIIAHLLVYRTQRDMKKGKKE
jgi:hypothetical protein